MAWACWERPSEPRSKKPRGGDGAGWRGGQEEGEKKTNARGAGVRGDERTPGKKKRDGGRTEAEKSLVVGWGGGSKNAAGAVTEARYRETLRWIKLGPLDNFG